MRVIFFNDTGQDMDMHAGSAKEYEVLKRAPAGHGVEFTVGDVDEVFIKVCPTLLAAEPANVQPPGARVTRVIWRANASDVNGCLLTSNALRQMADDLRIRRPPISFNFDVRKPPVGRVVSTQMVGDELRVTCDIHDGEVLAALLNNQAALRPGYVMEDAVMGPDGVQIVGSVSSTHLGVTPNPMPLPEEGAEEETPMTDDEYRQKARDVFQPAGTIEIAVDAEVTHDGDTVEDEEGAYVQAWCWVPTKEAQ